MGCGSCSGGACQSTPAGCGNKGFCATGGCNKLEVFDWLAGMEIPGNQSRIVEVRFKNTRKEFYRYPADVDPKVGDNVLVEANFGSDIGTVSLTGELVRIQMAKKGVKGNFKSLNSIRRIASQKDLDTWAKARDKEYETMIRARKLAMELMLDMKISDVEYQGDGTKATFYYTSDGRVDFRELIKVFASSFKVRVEMKQIGARQEAGRVGGIGSCGRELCCSTWLTDFRTVSTSAARYQQLAINPMKLAGQCGKLKCCLNYELDSYMDALSEFPQGDIKLKTRKGDAVLQKTDIFKKVLWFIYLQEPAIFHPVTLDRVKEIMEMNRRGKEPEDLKDFHQAEVERQPDFENVVGQDDLKRFDKQKRNKGKGGRNRKGAGSSGGKQQQARAQKGGNKPGNKKGNNSNQRGPKSQNNSQGNRPKNQAKNQNKNQGKNQGGGNKNQGGNNRNKGPKATNNSNQGSRPKRQGSPKKKPNNPQAKK
ncbi:hypothetical protein KFE98_06380 [bacterium SCSIO 12741]|nr:hypothetical protein KFE98_06380 [bacterium SCSIO 12741]